MSVENYSFETGDLSGWTFTYGTGNGQISMESVSAETTYFNEKAPYNQTGEYHFNGLLANENELYGYVVKSSVFNLTGSGYISFKMGGNAARIKVYKADGTRITNDGGYYVSDRANNRVTVNIVIQAQEYVILQDGSSIF